uniref:NADH-ubiquinone oxidoreductase chain 3 n=1 Tax=Laetmonice producta TaxID=2153329 RepID=A0A343W6E1_9ANNE|nr:NADH dehydrogenase subunit 3 [Laetmonice producta]
MILTFIMLSWSIILPLIIISISITISMKSNRDREKCSPFECGFDPKNNARIPFSLRFFLLAVIFLVFDIEIALLMPIPIMMTYMNSNYFIITSIMFLSILIIGLLHEWREGSLDWS